MKEIISKLIEQEKLMSSERGAFDLFALFLRDDAPGKWDLVVSAQWIAENKQQALKYIAELIQKNLSSGELLQLSRIVIVDDDNPALNAIQSGMEIEHGCAEIKDSTFFGLQIKHVYLITSKRRQNSAVLASA